MYREGAHLRPKMTHHRLASPGVGPGRQEVGRGLQRQYVYAGVGPPSGPAIKYSQIFFNGHWGFGVNLTEMGNF